MSISSESTIIMAQPIKLDTLPEDILGQILKHVFPIGRVVNPWWHCGMNIQGIRGWSKNDEGIAAEPNIDASFLRINKACHEAGTKILYGSNNFRFFHRPDGCKWWLKRITDRNIKKVRTMTFVMKSGWLMNQGYEDCKPRSDPEMGLTDVENSFEEDWAKALTHVHRSHLKLDCLYIAPFYWENLEFEDTYDEASKEELTMWRKNIIYKLAEFRGIKKVVMQEIGFTWIGRTGVLTLPLLMQQRAPPAQPQQPMPKLSLTELIEYCRVERLAREAWEAEVRARYLVKDSDDSENDHDQGDDYYREEEDEEGQEQDNREDEDQEMEDVSDSYYEDGDDNDDTNNDDNSGSDQEMQDV